MRKMTDGEVTARAETLKKRHRSEWCRLVFEACVGRTMNEVAKLLDYSRQWVGDHLKRYAIESAVGGGKQAYPLEDTTGGRHIGKQVQHVVNEYGPDEPDEDYVAEYEVDHTPEVAKCLATAYEAAENAIDAGVITEARTEDNRPASKITLPSGTDWSMRVRRACSDVKSAAGLLDRAKISDLKRAETRKQVALAHAAWMEQIARIENFHAGFSDEVEQAVDA